MLRVIGLQSGGGEILTVLQIIAPRDGTRGGSLNGGLGSLDDS